MKTKIGWIVLAFASCLGCGGEPVLDDAATAFVDAKEAIVAGDVPKALELLGTSIELRPDPWAYYERAKLHAEAGDDEAAKTDIEAGLELDPENSDLIWLQKQMKKPKRSRFKGSSGQPPMNSK